MIISAKEANYLRLQRERREEEESEMLFELGRLLGEKYFEDNAEELTGKFKHSCHQKINTSEIVSRSVNRSEALFNIRSLLESILIIFGLIPWIIDINLYSEYTENGNYDRFSCINRGFKEALLSRFRELGYECWRSRCTWDPANIDHSSIEISVV